MNALRRPIRKFNPGTLQSDDEIREQFVVRQNELDIVLEVLRGNLDASSCQHILIVAPRGRGKTMLLARVAAELRSDMVLSEDLLPVQFMEESQEIFTLADFWLETLFHLARASEAHDPAFARELRETHADFTKRWGEQMLEDHVRAVVLDAATRLGKKLVLMVENLQALCEDVNGEFGWKLRGALQSEPRIMLLATATSRFEGLDDAQEPFFELFRTVQLEPLNTEECRRLWRIVSGDTVSGREIRPLEILTGGSPRLLVIVAGFARHRSLRRLMEELVTLIDEHTEYFRGHLEVLPKSERRVYAAVLDLWRLSSPSEIAARARMDIRTVSTMLGRLVKRGAVRKAGQGRKQTYAAAEPLYSIYYKLRRERDEAAVVENLILFMVAFYDPSELSRMRDQLWSEARDSAVVHAGIARAQQKDAEAALVAYDEVIRHCGQSEASETNVWIATALLNRGSTQGGLGDFEGEIASYQELIDRYGSSDTPETRMQVAIALTCKGARLAQLGRTEEALHVCEELEGRIGTLAENERIWSQWQVPSVRALALMIQQKQPAALAAFRSAYAVFPTDDTSMLNEMLKLVLNLIAAGASEHDLVEILTSDGTKSDALAPLIVALRQRDGETVRAPAEVLEVAADVRKRIEEAIAEGFPIAS